MLNLHTSQSYSYARPVPFLQDTLLPLAYIFKGFPFEGVPVSGGTVRVTAVGAIVEVMSDVSVVFIIRD